MNRHDLVHQMQHRRLLTGLHHCLLTVTDSIGVDRSGKKLLPSWQRRIVAQSRLMRSHTVYAVDKVRRLQFVENKKQPLSGHHDNHSAADNINLLYGGGLSSDNCAIFAAE